MSLSAPILFQYLQEALALSQKGLGYVSPNPCVGCIILDKDLNKIAEGYHARYGEAHAEAHALNQVQDKSKLEGATVIVTLEPCAHEGKTPSCAKTLAQYPIKSVIALVKDPNPLVSGQGFEILQSSGCQTLFVQDLLSDQASPSEAWQPLWQELQEEQKLKKKFTKLIDENLNLNAPFLFAIHHSRPYVTLKWAQSLNAVIGDPLKRLLISGVKAQEWTHHLRATRDVTLVAYKTIMQDNPALNIRLGDIQKDNKIAIIDSRLKVLEQRSKHNILNVHSPSNTFLITDVAQKENPKCEMFSGNLIFVSRQLNGHLNIEEALTQLRQQHNVHSVLVEGGAELLSDFYEQNLWDEICVYVAPQFLKGTKIQISLMSLIFKFFKKIKWSVLGKDLRILIRK